MFLLSSCVAQHERSLLPSYGYRMICCLKKKKKLFEKIASFLNSDHLNLEFREIKPSDLKILWRVIFYECLL